MTSTSQQTIKTIVWNIDLRTPTKDETSVNKYVATKFTLKNYMSKTSTSSKYSNVGLDIAAIHSKNEINFENIVDDYIKDNVHISKPHTNKKIATIWNSKKWKLSKAASLKDNTLFTYLKPTTDKYTNHIAHFHMVFKNADNLINNIQYNFDNIIKNTTPTLTSTKTIHDIPLYEISPSTTTKDDDWFINENKQHGILVVLAIGFNDPSSLPTSPIKLRNQNLSFSHFLKHNYQIGPLFDKTDFFVKDTKKLSELNSKLTPDNSILFQKNNDFHNSLLKHISDIKLISNFVIYSYFPQTERDDVHSLYELDNHKSKRNMLIGDMYHSSLYIYNLVSSKPELMLINRAEQIQNNFLPLYSKIILKTIGDSDATAGKTTTSTDNIKILDDDFLQLFLGKTIDSIEKDNVIVPPHFLFGNVDFNPPHLTRNLHSHKPATELEKNVLKNNQSYHQLLKDDVKSDSHITPYNLYDTPKELKDQSNPSKSSDIKRSDEKKVQALDVWLENEANSHNEYKKFELNELDIRMRVRMKSTPENPQRMQYEKKITPETMLTNPTSDTDTKTIPTVGNTTLRNKHTPIEMEHDSRFVIPTNHANISEKDVLEYLKERNKNNDLYKSDHKYTWSDIVGVFRNETETKNYLKNIMKKHLKKKFSLDKTSIEEVRDIYRLRIWEQVSPFIMSPKGYDSTSYGVATFLRDYHAYWKYLVFAYKEDVHTTKLRYSNSLKYVVDSKEYISRLGHVQNKIKSLLSTPNMLPIFSLGDVNTHTSKKGTLGSFDEKSSYSQIEANLGNIYHVLMMRPIQNGSSLSLAHDSFEMDMFCNSSQYYENNPNSDVQSNNDNYTNVIHLITEHPIYESIKHAYSTIKSSTQKDLYSIFEEKMAPMTFNYMISSQNDEENVDGLCSNLHEHYDLQNLYQQNNGNINLNSNDINKPKHNKIDAYYNDVQSILKDVNVIDYVRKLKKMQTKMNDKISDNDNDNDNDDYDVNDGHTYDINSSNYSSNPHKGKFFINLNILKNSRKQDKTNESDIQDLYRIHSYDENIDDSHNPDKKHNYVNRKVSDDDIFLKCFRENVLLLSTKNEISEIDTHRKFKWSLLRKFVNYYTSVIQTRIKSLQEKIDKKSYDTNYDSEYNMYSNNLEREIEKNRTEIEMLTELLSGKIPLAQMLPRRDNLNDFDGIIRNDYPKYLKTDAYYATLATIENAKNINPKSGKRGFKNDTNEYLNEISKLWNKNFYFIPKNTNQNKALSLDNNRLCRYISSEQIDRYMNVHGLSKQYNYDQLLVFHQSSDNIELAGMNIEDDESYLKTTEDCQKGNDLNTLSDTMKNNIIEFIKLLIHNVPITIKNKQIRVKIDNPDNQIYVHPPTTTGRVSMSTMSRAQSYNSTRTSVKLIRPIVLGACVPLKEYPNEDLDSLVNTTKNYAKDLVLEMKTNIDKQCKTNADTISKSIDVIKDSLTSTRDTLKKKLDEEKEKLQRSDTKKRLEKEKYNQELARQTKNEIDDDGYDVYSEHKKELKEHIGKTSKHTSVLNPSNWKNRNTSSSDESVTKGDESIASSSNRENRENRDNRENKEPVTADGLKNIAGGRTIRGLRITT